METLKDANFYLLQIYYNHIWTWRGTEFAIQNILHWCKDYLKLVIFKKLEKQEELWKSVDFTLQLKKKKAFIKEASIFKGVYLSIPEKRGWLISRNLSVEMGWT